MKTLPRTLLKVLAVPLVLTVWACSDTGTPTELLDVPVASSVVVNTTVGIGDQFMFLQPLAPGEPTAPMATGLDLTVTVCDDSPTPACEDLSATEEDDHYHANWKSDKGAKDKAYTVTVHGSDYLDGFVLGALTLTLDKKDKAGRTFPIKFWVGEETPIAEITACVGDDRCNAEPVPDGEETTLVTKDEGGNTMGELILTDDAVPAGGLIITLDCRQGGYAAGEGPLPTDLNQWPLFCHVDVKNPDGTDFIGELDDEVSIDLCVVDELEPDQGPYHAFDHDDLVLGKSSDGSDFEFLEPFVSRLVDCDGVTTVASASPFGRIFDAIGTRVASVLSPVLPQKLYAAPMRRRDGGVGGLIKSFSDINPVEPALIEGTVADIIDGPLDGVTVTLTGPASATTLDPTTTDANGDFSFEPLQAAVGGTIYTVTVSGLSADYVPVDADVDVNVTGSGSFTADFATSPPTGIFYNPDTGNYYQAFAGPLSWDDARTAAIAAGPFRGCTSELVSVLSAEENAFIVANMPQATGAGSGRGGYWIGGNQPGGAAGGAWEWSNGDSFVYANWAGGEPNDSGNNEHTIQFNGDWVGGLTPGPSTAWNDQPANDLNGYVVEYRCGPPVVVSTISLGTATYNTPLYGGSGALGTPVSCPAGQVAVGIKGTTGKWYGWASVWDLGIDCRELLADGTLGAVSTVVGSRGTGGGNVTISNPFVGTCGPDQVLASLNGNHSQTSNPPQVTAIAGGCRTVSGVLSGATNFDSVVGPWSGTGSGSPQPWAAPCLPGYAVTGLTGATGQILDNVGAICTQLIETP